MSLPSFTTPRLVLRPLTVEDGPALHAAFSDPEVMTYWSSGPHKTVQETVEYAAVNATDDRFATWAVTENGAEALGWVTLIKREEGVAEIGFILRRDCWGRGYVGEAAGAVIAHGFEAMGLRRIFADVDPDNAGSIRVLEKNGFQYEGRLRDSWKTHIGVRDALIYSRLARDPAP